MDNCIFSIFGYAVTVTFDLLIPKPNQFRFVPRCTTDKRSVKIHQCVSHASTDGRQHIIMPTALPNSGRGTEMQRIEVINLQPFTFRALTPLVV